MDDLIEFLRAQLDDDRETAAVADALTRSPWVSEVTQDPTARNVTGQIKDGDGYAVVHISDGTPERAVAEHIARWDPARVLAEVDAKRRIIDLHAPREQEVLDEDDRNPICPECFTPDRFGDLAHAQWPCQTVRLLVTAMADREGYRSEWAP